MVVEEHAISIADTTQRRCRWSRCESHVERSPARVCVWRVACAEAAGTALLLLLTCLVSCAPTHSQPPSALYRALGSGLVVTFIVQSFDHVSGAMVNPTVTLAAVLRRHVTVSVGAAMCAAQVLGAVVGAGLYHALLPSDPAAPAPPDDVCVTMPAEGLSLLKAVCVEGVLGACLALANCASWDARNRRLLDSWPLRIGIIVAALSLAAGEVTGASMNPVRSLGPALWSGVWTHHWVYWVGPLGGSAVCALVYGAVWHAPPTVTPRASCTPPPSPRSPRSSHSSHSPLSPHSPLHRRDKQRLSAPAAPNSV